MVDATDATGTKTHRLRVSADQYGLLSSTDSRGQEGRTTTTTTVMADDAAQREPLLDPLGAATVTVSTAHAAAGEVVDGTDLAVVAVERTAEEQTAEEQTAERDGQMWDRGPDEAAGRGVVVAAGETEAGDGTAADGRATDGDAAVTDPRTWCFARPEGR